MEKEFKSGFVSLLGRTNVGKSTLLNNLVQEDVAITANKTQTTRTAIKAIINNENSQIIITDTPGIHKPKTKLSETMVDTAFTMIGEVDVILFVIEATSEEIKETVVSEEKVAPPEATAEGTTQAAPQGRGPRRPHGDRRPRKNFREKEEKIYAALERLGFNNRVIREIL